MILAFVGQKGGSAKTTTAVSVAAELVRRGASVLVVDADPQGTAITWGNVATQNGHGAITPAIVSVAGMGPRMDEPSQVPRVAQGFDHVIIDCPPSLGDVQRSALRTADLAVLPCGASGPEAWALATTITLVQAEQARRGGPPLAFLLATRVNPRTAVARAVRAAIESCGLPLLKASLGYRTDFQGAVTSGLGPTTYAPRSVAAGEIIALTDELLTHAPPTPAQEPHGEKAHRPRPRAASPARDDPRRPDRPRRSS